MVYMVYKYGTFTVRSYADAIPYEYSFTEIQTCTGTKKFNCSTTSTVLTVATMALLGTLARRTLLRAAAHGASPAAAAAAPPALRRPFSSSLVDNPNLAALAGDDYLYHLGLNPAQQDLRKLFGDVQFVCLGGSVNRMAEFADAVADELGGHEYFSVPFGMRPSPIGKTDRYSMFKVGPVLISSHGMGQPSMSILLHEVCKLLNYAGADDPCFIRLGTSGGLGVEPGTVVVSTHGVNGMLGEDYTLPVNGKLVSRPAVFHQGVVDGVCDAVASRPETEDLHAAGAVVRGKTMAADCFYEGQGRLDGAICDYAEAEKLAFLEKAHAVGVRNIEMESLQFGSFAHRLGLRATACCVTLLNRLDGDQVRSTPEALAEMDQRPGRVALAYIKHELGIEAQSERADRSILVAH